MKISILGKKYGKETAALIQSSCHEVFFGVPEGLEVDLWVMTDWDEIFFTGLKGRIRPTDIVILNGDDEILLQHLAGLLCNSITFGYHLKSTVTLSGMEEDVTTGRISYTFALQRPMMTCSHRVLEPCELTWSVPAKVPPQSVMAAGTFFLVADVAFFP